MATKNMKKVNEVIQLMNEQNLPSEEINIKEVVKAIKDGMTPKEIVESFKQEFDPEEENQPPHA